MTRRKGFEDSANLRIIPPTEINNIKVESTKDGYSLRTVIVVCILVSLLCQISIPYLGKILLKTGCRVGLVKFLGPLCPTQTGKPSNQLITTESEKYRVRRIYFEEPLPIEKWKGGQEPEGNLLIVQEKAEEEAPTDPSRVREALAAAKAARKSREDGNLDKAMTIIEHALMLAPKHPDILIEMGRVKEQRSDLLEADLCYAKALVYDPQHREALKLRARTGPLVSQIDKKLLRSVHDLRDKFVHLKHSTALRRAMRETYFLYVYHTVAIEGNTLSLGQTRAILESGMAIPGKSIREHNEVLGMDAALRFLNHSLLASDADSITFDDILEMHRRVLGHADPVEAGRLRTTQVYVGRFTPVAPQYVREQMFELVEWLNDPQTLEMDPVELAAIAHYKLVLVHPFTDGNGRTARLLLNLILMRSGFPPVILPVESRAEYYATLNVANLGDLRPFVRYVAHHTDSTLRRYISTATTHCIAKNAASDGDIAPPEERECFAEP
ncbi:unnamed protein product [Caenorhabditis auriculariae]|uniref:protein adenylyltransferase n=1 Tax=Caenorhabditis auriculariae TaxID=2777116 RepID=A0A8S1HEK3_9PELO|nr:unnamed protein product [Caenorhabditis auriculariae]